MKLNRSNILRKTNNGLDIYAYVLKQYYPEHLLQVKGSACQITKNPFNEGKLTLRIIVEDGKAIHNDLERPEFRGDVFDFANLYIKVATEEELNFLLNQQLHLGLKCEAEDNLTWLEQEDESWNPTFSYFKPPIRNTLPSREVTLQKVFKLIAGERLKPMTEKLRELEDPKEIRAYKANNFPYVTFAGVFSKRKDANLLRPSGLMVLDFDDLKDPRKERALLLQDQFFDTELMFISPSGNGLKWVIRYNRGPEAFKDYFKAVYKYLKKTYGLEADVACKDLSRACFLPFDPEIIIHKRYGIQEKVSIQ